MAVEFSENFAREIAAGIERPSTVCERYDVSEDEFATLQADAVFRDAVTRYNIEIATSGTLSRLKAQHYLDQGIDSLYFIMKNADEPKDRIAAWDKLNSYINPKGTQSDDGLQSTNKPFVLEAENPNNYVVEGDEDSSGGDMPFEETPDDWGPLDS